ncbi:MAG: M15 family metallopeptidase, partial [Clostridia bacterium]|nr:M15 family metallopeptidase [Clostridia bacterium]
MFLFVRLKKDLFPAVVFLEASIVCVSLSGCSDALAVFAGKTLSSAVSSAVSSSVSSAASSAASSAVSSAASSHTAAASPSSSVSYAPGADPPDNNGTASFSETARSGDMVDLQTFIPSLAVDLRYATTNNFTGTVIYNFSRAYLRRGTAVKLAAVVRTLKAEGYTLKVWDAYRPQWAQQKLWDFKPDPVYIANPEKGSNHTRGNTVDVTL